MVFRKEDFEVVYTKGSGPGGQHRNKVETACTVKHIPSGKVQRCQSSRSKLTNYETAMKLLVSKLLQEERQARHEGMNNIRKAAVWDESNGSNVIRTYNFQRQEVKDHRSGKTAPMKEFMNGKVDLMQISI